MASTGNIIDFGDLTLARWDNFNSMSSATRAVFHGAGFTL